MSQWISIEERVPDNEESVLVFDRKARDYCNMWVGWYDPNYMRWVCEGSPYFHVTHWMPLPEPPVTA